MLYVLTGDNLFQRDQEIARIAGGRDIERYEGADLAPERLGEVLAGQTLFATDSVTRIDTPSANKAVWEALESWAERVSGDVIVVEPKPDKRTRTYKALQQHATVIDCTMWSERQSGKAAIWLRSYSSDRQVSLSSAQIDDVVHRAIRPSDDGKSTVIDQQLLATVIDQLAGAETITDDMIDTVLAPSMHENVFSLFGAALDGDVATVRAKIAHLRVSQEAHMAFGLLGSQATNLAALVLGGDRTSAEIAKDIGTHPFALSQLERYAAKLSRRDVARIIDTLATADERLKRSTAEPWTLLEQALLDIALSR